MKRTLILAFVLIVSSLFFIACDSDDDNEKAKTENSPGTGEAASEGNEVHGSQIQPGEVTITTPLNTG